VEFTIIYNKKKCDWCDGGQNKQLYTQIKQLNITYTNMKRHVQDRQDTILDPGPLF